MRLLLVKFASRVDVKRFESLSARQEIDDILQRFHSINLKVIDHGKGIEKEKLGKLLKMMTSSAEGTGGELGTGIGLFVSQQMMERNGGTLAIESEEGKGTTVTLSVKK